MFIGAVRKFLDMEAITAPLVHELIDHIDVYEAEGKGKNKTQRVVIHYNFVGYLEIPENDEPCFTADTRQGVAIAGVILAFVMTISGYSCCLLSSSFGYHTRYLPIFLSPAS